MKLHLHLTEKLTSQCAQLPLKRAWKTTRTPNTRTTWSRQNGQMVQQLCHSTQPNGTVTLYLDPTRLNQVLNRPVHRGPTINDLLSKLTNAHYITIIDTRSRYHTLKLYKKSLYLVTFACQLDKNRFTRLLFRVVPAGNMFQQKIDRIFKDLQDVFGIVDDILIIGYDVDGRYHNKILKWVMQICQ